MHPSGRPLEGHSWHSMLPHHPSNSDGNFSAEWFGRRNTTPFDQRWDMNAPLMEHDFGTRMNYSSNSSFYQASNPENTGFSRQPEQFPTFRDHGDRNWSLEKKDFAASSQPCESYFDEISAENNQSCLSSRPSNRSNEPVPSNNMSSDRAFTAEQPWPSGTQTFGLPEVYKSGYFSKQHFSDLSCYGKTLSAQPDHKESDVHESSRLLLQDHLHQNFGESQMSIALNGEVHYNEISNAESSFNNQREYLGNSEQLVRPKNDVISRNGLPLRSNSSNASLADMYSRIEPEHGISNTDAMNSEPPPWFEDPKHSSMGKDSPKIGEADAKIDVHAAKGEQGPGLAKLKKCSKSETLSSTFGDAKRPKADGHGVRSPGLAKNVKKGSKSETVASTLGDKLWDGNLQLSSMVTMPALAYFKSGEKMSLINWAESLAVKGKVRLDAFEKYIQDLPRSRNRGLMVMSIHWKEGSSKDGLQSIKEVGKKYKQGKRVGYAQPASGIDLYICPRSEWIITILAKHGFFKGKVAVDDDQDSWIACAVWRKSGPDKSATKGLKEKSGSALEKLPSSPANSTTQHVNGPSQKSGKELGVSEAGESSGESKIPVSTVRPELATSNVVSAVVSDSVNSSVSLGQSQQFSQADLASLQKTLMHLSRVDASVLRSLGLMEIKANLELVKTINPSPRGTAKEVVPPASEDDDLPEYHFGVIPNKPSQVDSIDDRLPAGSYQGTSGRAPREERGILGPPPSVSLVRARLALYRQPQEGYEGGSSRKRARDLELEVHTTIDQQERMAANCGTTMSSIPDIAMLGSKSKGLFDEEDDDDMPEWCPPGFDIPLQQCLQGQLPVPSLENSSSRHMPPLPPAPPPMHFPTELQSSAVSHHSTLHFEMAPPPPLPPPPPSPPQSAPSMHYPSEQWNGGSSTHFSSELESFASHDPMTLGEPQPLHIPSEPLLHLSPSRSGPFSDMLPPPPPPPLPPPLPPLPKPPSPKVHFPNEHDPPASHDSSMPLDEAPSPPHDYGRNPSSKEYGSDYSRPRPDHYDQQDRYDRDQRHDRRDPRYPRDPRDWRDRRDDYSSSRWRGKRR